MLSNLLVKHLETQTGQSFTAVKPVSGGSINRVYCLQAATVKYLLKVNSCQQFPNMFKREQEGLIAIANTHTIAVPEVIVQGDTGDGSYLLMEWIDAGSTTITASCLLGQQLAQMHRHTAIEFGFGNDNYMGSLTQSNTRHTTWAEFFIKERLQPMVNMAAKKGELITRDVQNFETLYHKLPGLFTEEIPALIHGDLWSGNYLISTSGKPYLIDPAVSYGNREFDMAMTTLFGGFNRGFYEAYHSVYPLLPGWQ